MSVAVSRLPAVSAPPVIGYRVPSLGWRILGAALRVIPLVLILVGIPVAILAFLASHGITGPIGIATVSFFGVVLTALMALRYFLRPTVGFGPLAMATSAMWILYLWVLLVDSTYRVVISSAHATVSIGYGDLILILMAVPAFGLGAALLTTLEDAAAPEERLPFDFPV